MLVECSELTRVFSGGVTALDRISFVIKPGEAVALFGPSGCGKTTTLRLIAGLDNPTAGSIRLDGKDARSLPSWQRQIGFVFQRPAVYPQLSVRANLGFGLILAKQTRDLDERVQSTASLLGLSGVLDRLPAQLSGGQIQRVALGRALARQPRLLLLDEPFSQLDKPMRRQMRQDLHLLQRQLGTTMIYVTHDEDDLPQLVSRVLHLEQGRLTRDECLPALPSEEQS